MLSRSTTQTLQTLSLSAATILVALLASPYAEAVPIMSATASATINGGAPSSDTDTSATQANAQLLDDLQGEWNTQAASSASGQLGVSSGFLGASGRRADLTSTATWTDVFDYTSGAATFDFFIAEAIIGFEANNVRGLFGNYSVDISLNGVSLFEASASILTVDSTPSDPNGLLLTQTGPQIATFDPNITTGPNPGGAGYRFSAYTGSLALDPLIGTNTLVYTMSAGVRGLIGETGAKASIGDPLNLDLQPPGAGLTIESGPPPTPVPEPDTFVLLLLGLLPVAALATRRRWSGARTPIRSC